MRKNNNWATGIHETYKYNAHDSLSEIFTQVWSKPANKFVSNTDEVYHYTAAGDLYSVTKFAFDNKKHYLKFYTQLQVYHLKPCAPSHVIQHHNPACIYSEQYDTARKQWSYTTEHQYLWSADCKMMKDVSLKWNAVHNGWDSVTAHNYIYDSTGQKIADTTMGNPSSKGTLGHYSVTSYFNNNSRPFGYCTQHWDAALTRYVNNYCENYQYGSSINGCDTTIMSAAAAPDYGYNYNSRYVHLHNIAGQDSLILYQPYDGPSTSFKAALSVQSFNYDSRNLLVWSSMDVSGATPGTMDKYMQTTYRYDSKDSLSATEVQMWDVQLNNYKQYSKTEYDRGASEELQQTTLYLWDSKKQVYFVHTRDTNKLTEGCAY